MLFFRDKPKFNFPRFILFALAAFDDLLYTFVIDEINQIVNPLPFFFKANYVSVFGFVCWVFFFFWYKLFRIS